MGDELECAARVLMLSQRNLSVVIPTTLIPLSSCGIHIFISRITIVGVDAARERIK